MNSPDTHGSRERDSSHTRSPSPSGDPPTGLISGTTGEAPSMLVANTVNESKPPAVRTEDVIHRRKAGSRSISGLAQNHIPLRLNLTLENTGSVARDHLASERTYLAYVRTSLGIVSAGVALVQLMTMAGATNPQLKKYSKPLGSIFIILGLLTLALGAVRYFVVQSALVKGVYPAVRISVMLLSMALGGLIVVVFGIILAVK